MISAKNKRKLFQTIPFGVISMFFGLSFSLVEQGIMGDATHYPSTGNPYYFSPLSAVLFAGMAGLLIGILEVSYLNRFFFKRSYLSKILIKTLIYLFMIAFFVFFISLVEHSIDQKAPPWNKVVFGYATNFFRSFAFWSIEIFMGLGIGFALFYNEVSDNIGQSVLLNFFSGKYHNPIEEERVFMFLDMKDSTAIAEELGHIRYFELLKDYYADLTESIIAFEGQIYQYVGDEVVVTWPMTKGKLNNACIKCFFHMKAHFGQLSDKYKSRYGLVPSFKAGIHKGQVTTGEIGVVKKDIVFSGDVLNATARIQGLCNHYQSDLLVSKDLIDALEGNSLVINDIGLVDLKGREEKIHLYSVNHIAS